MKKKKVCYSDPHCILILNHFLEENYITKCWVRWAFKCFASLNSFLKIEIKWLMVRMKLLAPTNKIISFLDIQLNIVSCHQSNTKTTFCEDIYWDKLVNLQVNHKCLILLLHRCAPGRMCVHYKILFMFTQKYLPLFRHQHCSNLWNISTVVVSMAQTCLIMHGSDFDCQLKSGHINKESRLWRWNDVSTG